MYDNVGDGLSSPHNIDNSIFLIELNISPSLVFSTPNSFSL